MHRAPTGRSRRKRLGSAANVIWSCPASSTSNKPSSCSSSRRRSTSGRSSSRGGGWPSAGIRTSRRPGASTSISATCRRSTRRPTSSSSWPRPRAAAGSPATRSRCRRRPRARRARRPAGAPTRPSSAQRAAAEDRAKHDPFGSRVPDHSVVHRYARCPSYPEWGVGTVTGIYFSGDDEDVQQWARVTFAVGVRTVPAGSLQFVDFSKPDPAADRVQRFMTAAQHALAEGDAALAAQRLVYARDAEPEQPGRAAAADGRLLAGRQPAGGRAGGPRLGAGRHRPPHPGAVRLPDLRGHGRDRPGRRGGRPRRRPGPGRRLGLGAARAACGCG